MSTSIRLPLRFPIRLPLLIALPSLAAISFASAQDAYLSSIYQDSNYLQRGLFDAPIPVTAPQRARTKGDVERLTDLLHFSLAGGVRYDNNIYLTNHDKESDVIWSVTPTLAIKSGEDGTALNTFEFSYTPSFQVYTDNTDRNTVDHRASLRYGTTMPKSKLTFALDYTRTKGSDRFVSGTIDRNSLRGSLQYHYTMTGKTRLDLSATTDIDIFDTNNLNDRRRYDLRASVLYQYSGKTSFGPSVSYAHSKMSDSNDQDNVELGLKGEYQASGKINITGTLGYNVSSFSGTDTASNRSILAWSIAGSYQLSGKTNLRGAFYRNPKMSYNFDDTGYVSTGISLHGSHQYSERTSFYALLSYENDDYYETSSTGINTNDNYFTATLGARYRFDNGISCGANMTWRTNNADYDVNSFDGFSFGLNASYNFW